MDALHTAANALAELLEIGFQNLWAITVLVGFVLALRGLRQGTQAMQLEFAHYLALSLEFLLASDVLATLRAPSWQDIAQLAAVAAIRTGLDFYLSRELEKEVRQPAL
ncbi:MAG: hypothetical protein C4331_07060 [Meiothermus sp.]